MAEINKVIRIGDTLTNLLDKNMPSTYTKVTKYLDGTDMTDAKVDGVVYRKKGTEYFLKNYEYGQVLQKDTMTQMRALSTEEILLLRLGVYKHVQLNGYYVKEDTPTPINYILSNATATDDGGSIVVVGSIKLEHKFIGTIDVRYFGVKSDTSTERINQVVAIITSLKCQVYFSENEYFIDANYNGNKGVSIPSNCSMSTNFNTVFRCIPTSSGSYSVFSIIQQSNISIDNLRIEGDRLSHLGTTGEWGMGLDIREGKNIRIGSLESNNCWGDGLYLGKVNNGGYNENITIDYIKMFNNRRQGISVISIKNFDVKKAVIDKTNGISPQAALDLEPNNVEDLMQGIRIENLITSNSGLYSTYIALTQLNGSVEPVDIYINNFNSSNENALVLSGRHQKLISGKIVVNNLYSRNCPQHSVVITNYVNMPDLYLNKPTIINANVNGLQGENGAGITIIQSTNFEIEPTDYISKVVIDEPTFYQDEDKPLFNAIRVAKQGGGIAAINNVEIKNPRMVGPVFNHKYTYYSNLPFSDLYDDAVINVTTNDVTHSQERMVKLYKNDNATGGRKVVLSPHQIATKNSVRIEPKNPNYSFGVRFLNNIGYIIGISNVNGMTLDSNIVGSHIEIVPVDYTLNTWRILSASGRWVLQEGSERRIVTFNQKQTNFLPPTATTEELIASMKASGQMATI